MITWCGDPGWAAWMMTGGRSPAARWARRRLCEAELAAAVIEHAALGSGWTSSSWPPGASTSG